MQFDSKYKVVLEQHRKEYFFILSQNLSGAEHSYYTHCFWNQ